ncbi:MAG: hypothetical protein WEC37_03405 [Anaerolineales bacterium]
MFKIEHQTINWLMEGDPSVRWQVQRDLLGEKPAVYKKERAKVAKEGWGARFLTLQEKAGTWGKGIYSPKFISTHYTLLALRRIGLPPGNPGALKACALLINSETLRNLGKGFQEIPGRPADMCIVGMQLSMLAYFQFKDKRIHRIAEYALEHQMADGGWNCRDWRGDSHASFHTTCSVLEGLLDYQQAHPKSKLPLNKAQAGGREFLLQHRLYKSHRTGDVVNEAMTRFPFPPQWHYDFLKALDFFRASKAPRDPRAKDAIQLLLSRRDAAGRWPQYRGPSGKYFFQIESAGKPSRWNTLRALRVLKWWNT